MRYWIHAFAEMSFSELQEYLTNYSETQGYELVSMVEDSRSPLRQTRYVCVFRKSEPPIATAEPATHMPYRGSDVEDWIRRMRDEKGSGAWVGLDDLLEDYRARADTGRDLKGWVT